MGRQAAATVVVEGVVIAIEWGALVVAVADVGKTVKRDHWQGASWRGVRSRECEERLMIG